MTGTSTGTRQLQRPDGTLAYDLVDGRHGPLVVASPGLGDLRSTYRVLGPALAAGGARVATVDLRGHGGSSTGWPAYDEGAVADDLLALVEELGGPAVLVGNSYSGERRWSPRRAGPTWCAASCSRARSCAPSRRTRRSGR